MKIRFPAVTVLLLCALISCSFFEGEVAYTEVRAIDYEPDLESVLHSFENVTELLNPGDIVNVSDDYLIISDSDPDGFIKVFKLPELEFLYAWGEHGQGPHEFQYIPLNEINTRDKHIILYEIGTRVLREYEVTDSTLVSVQEFSLQYEGQTNTLTGITKVNEDFYIAEHGVTFDDNNFEFLALQQDNDDLLFRFGSYPPTELEGYEKIFAYLKTTGASNDGKKIAAFYVYQNKFKIFDNQGNLLKKFRVQDDGINRTENELDNFQYRTLKSSTDNFLYLMAMHEYGDEIEENIETFRTSFEKWDWNGNQINRARFDRPIHNFVVSEKHNKIYAYSVLDLHIIYEFNIP
jgi:hypothetical protein